ncbi:MAG: DNA topoisomerase IV subunit B [Bacillales bacterium]|jgi:DNA gyrase subunit B|nr:DNA topoisomerase IV subunit B [Bacillales bacterium]
MSEEEKKTINPYDVEQIEVLEGLEHVRLRPGMYIGSTGEQGLHHIVWEIIDNGVDEALAGYCDKIDVTISKDSEIIVFDNGRGIPTGIHPKTGVSTLQTVFAETNAGGKFGGSGYKASGGLHGVGASATNALSKYFEAWVHRDGEITYIRFENGKKEPVIKPHVIGKTTQTGTVVKFYPDETIFVGFKPEIFAHPQTAVIEVKEEEGNNLTPSFTFKYELINQRIKQLAFLNKGVTFTFKDERLNENGEKVNPDVVYKYDGGLRQYVEYLNEEKGLKGKDSKGKEIYTSVVYINEKSEHTVVNNGKEEKYDIALELAMQYNDGYTTSLYSFCNNINTPDGGTHVDGFKAALARIMNSLRVENEEIGKKIDKIVNQYVHDEDKEKEKKLKEESKKIKQEDVLEGLAAVISIRHPNPEYQGQTKGRLGNPEVRTAISQIVQAQLERYILENPDEVAIIVEKIINAFKGRLAAKAARETTRVGALDTFSSLPGKLADCSSKEADRCEIYIVEGDSAGGSAIDGRNRNFQAVLPLRGKILNVEKASKEQIFNNAEIASMIKAFGVGYLKQKDKDEDGNEIEVETQELDLKNLRYNKIIIMTDADVDGSHIRILMLTFFFRYLKDLITTGHIFIAQPPLYQVKYSEKDITYVYSDQQLDDLRALKGKEKDLQRYKGLGEMDAIQLWDTTMDPKQRVMKKVELTDAIEADKWFSFLMGNDSSHRKDFISEEAKFVDSKNIDF